MCTSVITDSHFLKDNLLCLVSNAVKYSDCGATIDIRISLVPASLPAQTSSPLALASSSRSTLSLRSQSGLSSRSHTRPQSAHQTMVMVTVEDTGIGISDTNKEVLFHPFQQAQRSAGGTGLGLFALSGRIRALGGTCGLHDREDGKQGSVFWFTFPYRPDELSEASHTPTPIPSARAAHTPDAVPTSPTAVTQGLQGLPPLRILLVDDAMSILKVTRRFLEKHGHTVETAENGNQSLELLKSTRDDFDVLITDLQMPVMDGFESVRRYREWEGRQGDRRLFILGMSANADDETRSDVFAVGMDAFVSKPFDYQTLVDELMRSPVFRESGKRTRRLTRLSLDGVTR
jgi:CheY-like chemotaxis protein